jgi:Protein of unknown function (DUF4054)
MTTMNPPAPLPVPQSYPVVDPATGAVVFNYQLFAATFPIQAQSVTADVATMYFSMAGGYFNNTSGSACKDVVLRLNILNMITAHLLTLFMPIAGEPPSGLVGRISNASEGSVSVGTDMGNQPAAAAWWNQTQPGATAMALMRRFARVRYYPGPRPVFDPYPGHFPPYATPWPIR